MYICIYVIRCVVWHKEIKNLNLNSYGSKVIEKVNVDNRQTDNQKTERAKHVLWYLSIFTQLRWVLEETPTHSGEPGVKVSNEYPWWYM